jgi:alpha-tubulin suppressor-like RCC1 family protein
MKTITLFLLSVISITASGQCFQKVVAGSTHFFAISQDGSLWAWGENASHQLGDGTNIDKTTPVQIATGSWIYASAGTAHSMGIKSDGTLWAWGSDSGGKLGNGASGNSFFPMQIGTDTNWKQVCAGESATIALKTDGTLWGWGQNTNGYLGNGQANSFISQVPVQIGTATDWKEISGTSLHCLAIKTNGTLWSWGLNGIGQLGTGNTTNSNVPVQIGVGTNWKAIDTNYRLSFALKTDGTLWGWGTASASGTMLALDQVLQPLQIGIASDWRNFSLKKDDHQDYLLLTKTNGTLWAWGNDTYEQLGNGTINANYAQPTQIGTQTDWTEATAGFRQSSAVKVSGTFWVWGTTLLAGDGSAPLAVPTQYACTSLAVAQNELYGFSVYPNPVADRLVIESNDSILSVKIFDLNGRNFKNPVDGNSILVSNLSAGIYLLTIETEKGVSTRKFVKL